METLRVIHNFFDKVEKYSRNKGQTFEADDKRAKQLLESGFVELVEKPKIDIEPKDEFIPDGELAEAKEIIKPLADQVGINEPELNAPLDEAAKKSEIPKKKRKSKKDSGTQSNTSQPQPE